MHVTIRPTLGLFFALVVEFPKAFGVLRYLGQTHRQTDRQLCSVTVVVVVEEEDQDQEEVGILAAQSLTFFFF